MECPHLFVEACARVEGARFPHGSPSSWCCSVCRSNKSPWVCLTCSSVHCGRYVNGHAKRHYEEAHAGSRDARKGDKETEPHAVCMDCNSYSAFCYRCDDFVVNDNKLGSVQRLREHLQSLENSERLLNDRNGKRKCTDAGSPSKKHMKLNGSLVVGSLSATGLRNLGNTCFMNAILQSLSNIQQFCCFFKELPAVELRSGKTAGRRMYHTRSQGIDCNISLVEEFRKTLCSLWQGSPTAFSPDSLFYVVWKVMPNFRGYQQQDAHEFMRYLLDHLHMELQCGVDRAGRSCLGRRDAAVTEDAHAMGCSGEARLPRSCRNGVATVVTDIFGGILQSDVNCLICGTESKKFDPFLGASLSAVLQWLAGTSPFISGNIT